MCASSCDGPSLERTPIKKNRKNRETYYYPSETESGSYCTGIDWETGDAITCWKNARSFVVRTPKRKSSDDGAHQIATNGVLIRTPVRIPGKERDMLRVSFLTYKPSEGEEIMYEVDDKGRYTGNDRLCLKSVRDVPIPERYVFDEAETRRKLFIWSSLLSQGVDSLDAAAFPEKTEKLDTCSR
ncbi:uncharacterized protein RSE6_05843 [Rhynchosporium secalis]|uniref:Uncharacterized protein n=1 Tax=Rhynchosporium secalis TaxID=38038 RepID=A0A1E1M8U7_RHYSE|nr:uncharacterized protein RSE6_05843 [Rhynchosporium secalis]